MRKALLFFHFTAVLFAVDPPYFIDNIEAVYLADIVSREKLVFIPGTLNSCKTTYTSATYTSMECGVDNAEIQLTIGAKTVKFPVGQLSTTEYQYDPAEPSVLTYNFMGKHSETLSNGMVMESGVSLYFDRKGVTPNRIQGRFSLTNFSLGGSFLAELKTTTP